MVTKKWKRRQKMIIISTDLVCIGTKRNCQSQTLVTVAKSFFLRFVKAILAATFYQRINEQSCDPKLRLAIQTYEHSFSIEISNSFIEPSIDFDAL